MLNAGASSREAYDNAATNGRGNLTQTLITPKSGSGLSPITTSAIFPTTCTNAVTCNLPTSTTDGRGNTTNYVYDATTELVTSGTPPAVAGGQPQTRYSNSAYQAYYYNSAGSIAASGAPVTVLTGISACCSSASCTGTADENKTSFAYGPQSTGIVDNLLPVSWSAGSGDEALTATSAASYDMIGNLASIDGPLPGSARTTHYRHNADRELIGATGPDPDGSGPLRMRAQRLTSSSGG